MTAISDGFIIIVFLKISIISLSSFHFFLLPHDVGIVLKLIEI